MDLLSYLQKRGIPIAAFARRVGISNARAHAIVKYKENTTLKTALAIEDFTEGQVTCRDLLDQVKQ